MPFRTRTQARAAAHASWAKTADRAARTAKAREAAIARFEREVDPDQRMSPRDRRKAATNAQRAHMLAMSQKGVDKRSAKRAAKQAGSEAP
ncbi:hypothetical protein HZU40_09695 [Mycolicibacterium fluoranthenivorans]|uniref:Uncharacterized protein n=1 Tax=Mycolicibacterium fluoranthenivorans TaxID=258505 RepID=A0A7G8PB05_9MYCO|nr:hypothetical protein [Mycolicibacterium fluoranthenivorans]QNJ91521.1 hypothetical protein HZU40_25525 [Mycolicibacterium fluoranthenivorans]QNJ94505.1 hypothetical protein HZU40_09695 [Mycolicibacterium fluoranthenivorans]